MPAGDVCVSETAEAVAGAFHTRLRLQTRLLYGLKPFGFDVRRNLFRSSRAAQQTD